VEAWESTRDWLIGWCGKSELDAERTGWVELRALQKAERERQYGEWCRARFVAHTVYLNAPVFGRGVHRETDPTRFYPLPLDEEIRAAKPVEIVKITEGQLKELQRIKGLIK